MSTNLVPLAFNDIRVTDYMSAMIALYELQDITPLADLYAFTYQRTSQLYDTTVKSIRYDEIRVRYRDLRRRALKEVIIQKMPHNKAIEYANSYAQEWIPFESRIAFTEDLLEDLEQLDLSRLIGLDVTPNKFTDWKQIFH